MSRGNTGVENDYGTGTFSADGFVLATTAAAIANYHSGDIGVAAAATGTDTTPVVTEAYVAQVNVLYGTTLTGIALLNGSAVAGNMTLYLADANGVVVASTASTAQAGTAAYQQVAFTTAYTAKSGKYYIVAAFNNTGARFRSHILGNFGAGKLTGLTYGTLANFTPPTTFTTNLGPIADTY